MENRKKSHDLTIRKMTRKTQKQRGREFKGQKNKIHKINVLVEDMI